MKRRIGAAVLVTALALVTACSGGAASAEELDYYAEAARVFNGNETAHRIAAALANTQETSGKVYASVGTSADYPDQVLITVSAPGKNLAFQFMFDPANPSWSLDPEEVDADSIPESVTQWNMTVDDQGYLLVNGREEESMP